MISNNLENGAAVGSRQRIENNTNATPLSDSPRIKNIVDLNKRVEKSTDIYLSHLFPHKKIEPKMRADLVKGMDMVIQSQIQVQKKGTIDTAITVKAVHEGSATTDFFSYEHAAQKEVKVLGLVKEDRETIHQNLLRRYIIKGLEIASTLRDRDNYVLSPFFEEARLNTNVLDVPDSRDNEAREILMEMNRFGIDTIQNYYQGTGELALAKNENQLRATFEKWNKSISNDRVLAYFQKYTQQKLQRLRADAKQQPASEKKRAGTFFRKFEETWNYVVDYATPDAMKSPLSNIPKSVLTGLYKSRENASSFTKRMSDSERLRKWFWQLRLGRNVKQYIEEDASKTQKDTDFKRYQESMVDKMLHTEAAGYDCLTGIESNERSLSNSGVIQKTIESLMSYEKSANRKQKEMTNFTIFLGENSYAKIAIPTIYRDKNYLNEQIKLALEHANVQKINLSARMRAELKYMGYSTKRAKDETYRKYFGYDNQLVGDYIIQIKDAHSGEAKNDEYLPQSMFAVDSHKAAVLVDMRRSPPVNGKYFDKIHIKYNHKAFDGLPAKKHFTHVVTDLETSKTEPLHIDAFDDRTNTDSTPQFDTNKYPSVDGRATLVDNGVYKKISIKSKEGKDIVVSPTLVRSLVLAMANDVDYFHVLYAQDLAKADNEKREYLEMNKDFYSDVQAAVVSFNHFKEVYREWESIKNKTPLPQKRLTFNELIQQVGKGKNEKETSSPTQQISEWTGNVSKTIERAKNGDSDAAVFAAIPGSHESLLYKVGLAFNEGAKLLRNSQGMISPMPDTQATLNRNIVFYTAQSDAYNPNTINLAKPEKNLGVVGYSQEGKKGNAFYSVRKFPGQAQVEFHDVVVNDLLKDDKSPTHAHHTLKEFTKVVKAWDSLYRGKVSLSDYIMVRDRAYETLKNWDICGEKNLTARGIRDINGFQDYLNRTLEGSAKSTLNKEKIDLARQNFYEFFQTIGAKIG